MGGRRGNQAVRCARCRMLVDLCVCAEIPSIPTLARWLFVQHRGERRRTTNTGRLAWLGLRGSALSTFAGRGEPLDPPLVLPSADAWLLWPRGDEPPVPAREIAALGRPPAVVVLDGTWGEARKVLRGVPGLDALPRVALPEGARARWSLRQETSQGGMSTLDAVCWLLAALEGPEAAAPLERLARLMWERTMASRGTPVAPGGAARGDPGTA